MTSILLPADIVGLIIGILDTKHAFRCALDSQKGPGCVALTKNTLLSHSHSCRLILTSSKLYKITGWKHLDRLDLDFAHPIGANLDQSMSALANSTQNRIERLKTLTITLQSDPAITPSGPSKDLLRVLSPQLETLTIKGGTIWSSPSYSVDFSLFSHTLRRVHIPDCALLSSRFMLELNRVEAASPHNLAELTLALPSSNFLPMIEQFTSRTHISLQKLHFVVNFARHTPASRRPWFAVLPSIVEQCPNLIALNVSVAAPRFKPRTGSLTVDAWFNSAAYSSHRQLFTELFTCWNELKHPEDENMLGIAFVQRICLKLRNFERTHHRMASLLRIGGSAVWKFTHLRYRYQLFDSGYSSHYGSILQLEDLCDCAFTYATKTEPFLRNFPPNDTTWLDEMLVRYFTLQSTSVDLKHLVLGLMGHCVLLSMSTFRGAKEREKVWRQILFSLPFERGIDESAIDSAWETILSDLHRYNPHWSAWIESQLVENPDWLPNRRLIKCFVQYLPSDRAFDSLTLRIATDPDFCCHSLIRQWILYHLRSEHAPMVQLRALLDVAANRLHYRGRLRKAHVWLNLPDLSFYGDEYEILFSIFEDSIDAMNLDFVRRCYEETGTLAPIQRFLRAYNDSFGKISSSYVHKMKLRCSDSVWSLLFTTPSLDLGALRPFGKLVPQTQRHRELLLLEGDDLEALCESCGYSLERVLAVQQTWRERWSLWEGEDPK